MINRQIEANGITKENIIFADDGLKFLIAHYTREAGLRNLEREIGSVCRKVAKKVVLGESSFIEVNEANVPELLGPPRFLRDEKLGASQAGVVTELCWTQAGCEVLSVEFLKYRGKEILRSLDNSEMS